MHAISFKEPAKCVPRAGSGSETTTVGSCRSRAGIADQLRDAFNAAIEAIGKRFE